jgi:hypothetical protein
VLSREKNKEKQNRQQKGVSVFVAEGNQRENTLFLFQDTSGFLPPGPPYSVI